MATKLLGAAALVLVLALAPAVHAAPQLEQRKSEKGLEYSVRIPDGHDRSRCSLVVFALHGRGGSKDDFMKMTQSYEWLKSAVIVAPQAPNAGRVWDVTDLGAMTDLLREVQEEQRPARTIFFGHSAGGFFSMATTLSATKKIQAAIPVGGGLPGPMPVPQGDAALQAIAFYVIHGDADSIVPVENSRKCVEALEKAGVKHVKYEEQKGVGHVVDPAAVKRAFEWVESVLGPALPELSDAQVSERLKAIEKAVKAKDWEAAVKGFDALEGVPRRAGSKVAALAKASLACEEESVGVAAANVLGRLGPEAIGALKTVKPEQGDVAEAAAASLARTGSPAAAEPLLALLKGKNEFVAAAAAKALRNLRGDAALGALIGGLAFAEGQQPPDARKDAILDALKRLTGQSFGTAREWKAWAGGR